MTAFEFIDQLFSRPQAGIPCNMRRISRGQLELLRTLIGQDEEGGAIVAGERNSVVWAPRGRTRYVITDDPTANKRTLMKLMVLQPCNEGQLFPVNGQSSQASV